jgi:hypothetical protein
MSLIKLFYKGGTFINNPEIVLKINEVLIEGPLTKAGFNIEHEIPSGDVLLDFKFGPRKQQFKLNIQENETLDLELKYSRLWGNFKLKERT